MRRLKLDKLIPKFIWKCKGLRIAKTILKKEEQSWKTHTTWFQTYYKAKVIKIVWYWHIDRHIDQWNRIEESKSKALHLWSTEFWLGCQYNSVGERMFFSINCTVITGYLHEKEWSYIPTSHHIQKVTPNKPKT